MKQYCKIISLSAAFVFVCIVFFTLSTEAQYNITTVQDSAFDEETRKRPVVSFYHDEHNDAAGIYECNACHHVWEDGEKDPHAASIGMECSECHLSDPGDTEIDLIRAYHLQCRTCHMEEKAGPILCGECHTGER